MSIKDKEKWDTKYQQKPELLSTRPPSSMLVKYCDRAPGKKALDLACGSGRHTLFLAKQGFHVDAVDISSVALSHLRMKTQEYDITLTQSDLDTFTPHKEAYDLIVMTNYLDRALIRRTSETLKKNALFIVETYMQHPENEKKETNPDFLLAPEELKSLFDTDFTLLAYKEFWNESHEIYRMRKQAIVVQKE